MTNDYDYERIRVEVNDGVATLFMYWPDGIKSEPIVFHRELVEALHRLRHDDAVRVVVIRGAGERYFLSHFPEEPAGQALVTADRSYTTVNMGSERWHSILRMPKPVVAMVNGDALGIGATMAFACDIIIAAEDVYITDSHMASRYWDESAAVNSGAVAGDGGSVFWPMNMSLCIAKEYLFLGRPVKARELADLHAINRAVQRADLQDTVDEMVNLLLERPAWALGWTKLALNKRLLQNFELTHDASLAWELITVRVNKDAQAKGVTVL